MYVLVDVTAETRDLQLVGPEDSKTFSLVVRGGGDTHALRAALGERAVVDEDGVHAWLRVDAVRALAGRLAEDSHWCEQFDDMLAYAGSKGWLSESGDAIRAHIDRE